MIYKQDFYKYFEKEIEELFMTYHVFIMENLDHPALIEEWKQNIDAASYEEI